MTTEELLDQAVTALSQASSLVEGGVKMAQEKQAVETKLASAIPAAVELLIQSQQIREDERTKAANVLADHAKAVGVIQQLAKEMLNKAASPTPIGSPVGEKRASAASAGMRESDAMLFERFGVPVA